MPVLTRRRKQSGERDNERGFEEALSTLLPLGFDRELILSIIRHLLEVYGDELGWKFIEEESYKVVIDRILEGENNDSDKRDELDDKENNTKQAQIDSFDVKFGENNLKAEADIELFEEEADGSRQSVARTESQLSSSSISYGSLTRKTEKKSGISSVCADRDGTFTFANDIGTSSAQVDEIPHCSSNRDGEVDRDVLPAMLDPLDDSSVSVKAEMVSQNAVDVGRPHTGSLQGSLGCRIEKHNSWERVGENEAHDLMLVGKQADLEKRNNIGKQVVLSTSSVLEVKKTEKERIDEQSTKKSDGYEQRNFISPIFPTIATYSHASTEKLEPGEIPATTDEIQEFYAQSNCNERNCMVPLNPVHFFPTLQVQPGSWGYANFCQNTSVSVGELQKQEVPLYLSSKNNFAEGRLTVPPERKPCHGWLSSDEELSPREPTISTLGNEIFCSNSEMAVRGNNFREEYGPGRDVKHETNIELSMQVILPDKSSIEYDCKHTQSEKNIRPAGRLIQQCRNLSEDIFDKYGRAKYEDHNARKSVEMVHQKLPHGIEVSRDESCKFHKEQEERNARSSLFETSTKSHSSWDTVHRHERYRSDRERNRSDRERYRSDRERYRSDRERYRSDRERYRSDHKIYRSDRERYRSDHRNDRRDTKYSQQPMDKHSSRHEKTSAGFLKYEPQKREHRRKYRIENAQNPVEQTTDSYTKEIFSEYRHRQSYERKSENTESRSYEKWHISNQRNDSEKERSSMEAVNKHPLLYVNDFSQEAKLGTDHDHAKVKDEGVVLEPYSNSFIGDASPCKKRYKGNASPCKLHGKSRRDVIQDSKWE